MFKTVRIALVIAASGVTFACAQPGAVAPTVEAASVEAQRGYKIEDTLGIGPVYGTKLRGVGVVEKFSWRQILLMLHRREGGFEFEQTTLELFA